jgi:hypothetical protein
MRYYTIYSIVFRTIPLTTGIMQYHAFNVSPTKGRMNSPPPTPRENTGRTAASAGEAGPGMRKRTYPQISQIDADGENQEEDARRRRGGRTPFQSA